MVLNSSPTDSNKSNCVLNDLVTPSGCNVSHVPDTLQVPTLTTMGNGSGGAVGRAGRVANHQPVINELTDA